MKKLFFIVSLLAFFFSCKEAKERINELPDPFNGPDKIVDLDTLVHNGKEPNTVTLTFEKLSKAGMIDKVIVVPLKKDFTKDSIEITKCRLDFYLKDKIAHSFPVEVYGSSEDPMWSLYEGVFTDEKKNNEDMRFFELSFGVPACGYTHSNFLFFTEKGELQLVKKYDSMGDGPYSDGFSFEPKFSGAKVISFISKRMIVNNDESKPYNDENEDLIIDFSDSTFYTIKSGKWTAEPKSPKDKIYRRESTTYKKFFRQE